MASRSLLGLALAVLLNAIFWGAVWLMLGAFRIFCFTSVDSFWLIQTGRAILTDKHLPSGDIFSFTCRGAPWVVYQWLFEVAVGAIHRLGGLPALQALVLALAVIIFGIVALRGMLRAGVSFAIAWFVCATAAFASLTFVTLRPQLVSILFMYAAQRLLDSHWRAPSFKILWLVPLFLLWSDTHIMFAVGLAAVFLYWMSSLAAWFLGRGREGGERRAKRARLIGIAAVAAMAASLANPYGWGIFEYGLSVCDQSFWTRQIGEMLQPEFNDPLLALILNYILLTVASFMVSKRRPSFPEGLVYLSLLGAGLTSYKLLPLFLAASMHGTALRLHEAFVRLEETARVRIPSLVREAFATVGCWFMNPVYPAALVVMAVTYGLTRPVLLPPWLPLKAADYLDSHPVGKRLFCSAKFGSYLIYRFGGRRPVFIDTRFDLYGPLFAGRYFAAHRMGVGWNELVKEYGIDGAFVQSQAGIAAYLRHNPGWKEVYRDSQAEIFVPSASCP